MENVDEKRLKIAKRIL